tara:strand:- start:304 stop:1146 length:843 start_codon:yes stop_codon:yes gene_type:complete
MNIKKILIFLYKKISHIYIFIFGRKNMQSINNVFLSLTLNAKGYKNFGNFAQTGEKKFIQSISKDLKICIDVGANVGKYTNLLLSETNSEIISFEPLKEAYKELQKIEKEYPNRLRVFNYAIGEKNTNLELNFSDEKSEKATFSNDIDKLSFFDHEKNKKVMTDIVTLDSFLSDNSSLINMSNIDLIKIDTEGFELEVIKGAKETIKNKLPKYIQLEFNWHQLFKNHSMYKFSQYLNNYELFQILPFGEKLIKVDPTRPETNIFHLSNFVYIRKDISIKF